MRKLRILKLLTWYKELQEEKVKMRIYQAKIGLEKLLLEKKLLEEEYNDSFRYLQETKIFSADELKAWFNYFEVLKEFKEIAEKKIETQQKYLEDLRKDLLQKNREKRLMERLYHRTLLKFNRENYRKFLKDLDDLVLLRRGRGFD
ncbi:MAG: hypothetical protein ACP5HI_01010 [Caldimicrobium sp.]